MMLEEQTNNPPGALKKDSGSAEDTPQTEIVDPEASNEGLPPLWYMESALKRFDEVRASPLYKIMNDAIFLYSEEPIALVRQIYKCKASRYKAGLCLGMIPTTRGTKGTLINPEALTLFPEDVRKLLAEKLKDPDIRLCSLGEWIFTLKIEDFKILKKR